MPRRKGIGEAIKIISLYAAILYSALLLSLKFEKNCSLSGTVFKVNSIVIHYSVMFSAIVPVSDFSAGANSIAIELSS